MECHGNSVSSGWASQPEQSLRKKTKVAAFQDNKNKTEKNEDRKAKETTYQFRFLAARYERRGRVKNRCGIWPQVRRQQPEKHLVTRRSYS